MKRLYKTFAVFVTSILLFTIVVQSPVLAITEISRATVQIDESLADKSDLAYKMPSKIVVSRIESGAKDYSSDSYKWVRMLYYYYITRLGLADLPYNYIVDSNGVVFQGKAGYEGVQVINSSADGLIHIGYLSNDSNITSASQNAIAGIITDLSGKYLIKSADVNAVTVKVNKSSNENQLATITFAPDTSDFSNQLQSVIATATYSTQENVSYKAEVSNINYSKSVKAGEKMKVTLDLTNIDDFPWYTDKDLGFIYLSTKDGKDSKFAVNGVWDSFSKPLHIQDKTIMPGETYKVEFDLQALLLPGDYSENFQFTRLPSKSLSNSEFTLSFNVTPGSFQLVEILETDTGFLNVRDCAGFNCSKVGQVDIGRIYIMTGEEDGWTKIKYSGESEGWVSSKYVKKI